MRHYILDGHKPVVVNDVVVWGRWMQTADRHVALDTVGDVRVSTVFLGLDHRFGPGSPVLFETMVFGGPLDQEQNRYATWDEALAGHHALLKRVTARQVIREITFDDGV
jgi:hypothetical protein